MNITKYNLSWLTFILSAIFVSCEKTDATVGSGLQDKEGVFSHYILDDLDITSGTIIKNDSLYGTSSDELVYVGNYSDEIVGSVKAEAYIQLGLGGDGPDFGTNPVCDSVVLQINLSSSTEENRVIQGNSSADNTLFVHELTTQIQTSALNSTNLTYGEALGSVVFNAARNSTDSISISLPTDFGMTLIQEGNNRTNDEFKISFNGIALTSLGSDEAIVAYDLDNSDSWVRVYYHNDETASDSESKEYNFNIASTLENHTYLKSDKSNSTSFSSISNTLTDKSGTNNQVLFQNGIGASVVLTIEDFIDQIDSADNVLVNRAIIRLPIDPSFYEEQFNEAVPFVRVFETDAQGENIADTLAPLLTDGSFVVGGTNTVYFFDEDELYYEIDLTYYFQEYLLGLRPLNSLMITPNLTSTTLGVERTAINADEIVFKLFYSEL